MILGLVLTVFRLAYRIWLGRFWVEDAWAGVAFLCGVAAFTSCWTYTKAVGEEGIISFWVYSFTFPSVVWAVRQSILFSIVRIVYATQHLRRLMFCLAGLFLGLWAGLVVQKAWHYGHNTSWYQTTGKVHILMTQPMIMFELITDCLSDTILIILPLRLLWSLRLPKRQKKDDSRHILLQHYCHHYIHLPRSLPNIEICHCSCPDDRLRDSPVASCLQPPCRSYSHVPHH